MQLNNSCTTIMPTKEQLIRGREMNSTMKYKNYIAAIHYDDDDKIFWGEIIGMRDIIAFHGESVSELETRFHTHVDEYLQYCEKNNINPDKTYSGTFNIRIKPEAHKIAAIKSASENISLNQYIAGSIELMNYLLDIKANSIQLSKQQLESYLNA